MAFTSEMRPSLLASESLVQETTSLGMSAATTPSFLVMLHGGTPGVRREMQPVQLPERRIHTAMSHMSKVSSPTRWGKALGASLSRSTTGSSMTSAGERYVKQLTDTTFLMHFSMSIVITRTVRQTRPRTTARRYGVVQCWRPPVPRPMASVVAAQTPST